MRRWSADRIILCSLVILALVLPAAPAMAEGAAPDCDRTWTPDLNGDYNADTPANWSPPGIPVATDVVCLPAGDEYGNYVAGGTITAAELHILSDSAQFDGATNLQVPVIHSTATPGGIVDLSWVNLSAVTTLASGRIQIGSVEQLGYEGVTSTFEVLESATLAVNVNSYQSTTRPLTVNGELNFINAVDWSTWVGFSAPVNIPGTLRLSSPEWYQDRLGCAGCAEYGLTFYTESTTHISGSVVVEDGMLDLSNAYLTVGQDPVAPVTVEDGRTVLNGPAGGYVVSTPACSRSRGTPRYSSSTPT